MLSLGLAGTKGFSTREETTAFLEEARVDEEQADSDEEEEVLPEEGVDEPSTIGSTPPFVILYKFPSLFPLLLILPKALLTVP